MTGSGLHVALLGIDGTGKTAMAKMLSKALADGGHDVKMLSWRKEISANERENTRQALRQLWVESFRLLHLGVDAPPPPPAFAAFEEEGWEERYGSTAFTRNVPAGPLAAAWLEWVGQVLLYHEAVLPHTARGTHVIDESFSLKMAYKELYVARKLATGPMMIEEIERAQEMLTELFQRCAPDVGLVISGPVERSYRWRMAQKGSLGPLEDLGAAGEGRGRAGYLELQSACDGFFREFAAKWGWHVFEMQDGPAEANFARLRAELAAHPRLAALLG
ncbi:hypothetical protein DMP23_01650 [Amycolatopsis sp. A1MSW2902]|uniref:hypothetical protein n=1 Tax=Amycolatopsis sp. A1MSW2902 TaxID=687413 RepID=UPI00307EC18A